MQVVNEEPLSEMLRLAHPKLYSHVLNCYLQSVSCYIRLEQYDEALRNCDTILEIESNYKALYLKGCISEELSRPTDALILYQAAKKLAPGSDTAIEQRLRKIQTQISDASKSTIDSHRQYEAP